MKKNTRNKISLEVLKYQAIKARQAKQLPYKLVYYINKLTKDSSIDEVKWLSLSTEHLFRVKGYYQKFPQAEKETNELVYQEHKKLFGF